jgi:NADH dehydrogenase FAD-containing subunit
MARRVVILGGGFGGLFTARRLAALAGEEHGLEIVLVDRAARFVFKPLLYELLTGEVAEDEIAPRLDDILRGSPVRYLRAEAKSVDLATRRVTLAPAGAAGEEVLSCDALVIALGAEPFFRGLADVEARALTAATLDDFRRLTRRLDEIAARPPEGPADLSRSIGVCGAGPSGVEVACKLADLGPGLRLDVTLVEASGTILPGFGEEIRAVARERMDALGVTLRLRAPVRGANAEGLALEGGFLRAGTIVWTAGQRPVALVRALPADRDPGGRLTVGATLELPRYPGVFALGDAAKCVVEGAEAPPATAQVAVQQAAVVARNVLARLEGRTLSSFRYFPLAETLSLGRGRDAFHVLGVKLGGRVGSIARRLAYLARIPGWRQRVFVGARWSARWAAEAVDAAVERLPWPKDRPA